MNVGLIQVTSRKSPTNCGGEGGALTKRTEKKQQIAQQMMFINRAPCQGGGQWFWVMDILLLSVYTGRQRIYVSLKTEVWREIKKKKDI